MASFKILKGLKSNLPSSKTDGTMYYTTDEGIIYVDYKDGNSTSRKALNADVANKLKVARTFSLKGDVTGSATFDGSGNVEIEATVNGKAPTSHATSATTYGVSSASNYGHAKASSTTPKANGTASAGSETGTFARGDHVHPVQTSVSGNAGTATTLATARTIALSGDVSGSVSFNGSEDVTITTTVADSSHNHAASNITSGTLDAARLPAATSSTLGAVKIGSNINVSSGTISVPAADGSKAGVTVVYPAASCTTFSSDSGTVTPLAV